MSINDIMAIRGLLPGVEPDLFEKKQLFRDKADENAALAEADLLLEQLREKYDDDQDAIDEEFHAAMEDNERLSAAVLRAVCRQWVAEIETKQQRAGRAKR